MTACTRLGFTVEHTRGRRVFAIELGSDALVDSLPGVRSGSTYVGSFDREEAVEDETLDFFASGHPLVEGILAHFEDSVLGRVARIELGRRRPSTATAWPRSTRTVPISRSSSSTPQGRPRADWAAALRQRPLPDAPSRGRRVGPRGVDGHGPPAWRRARSGAHAPRARGARRAAGAVTSALTTSS